MLDIIPRTTCIVYGPYLGARSGVRTSRCAPLSVIVEVLDVQPSFYGIPRIYHPSQHYFTRAACDSAAACTAFDRDTDRVTFGTWNGTVNADACSVEGLNACDERCYVIASTFRAMRGAACEAA